MQQAAQRRCAVSVLEGFRTRLDKSLSSLVWPQSWSCFELEIGLETAQSPFQPQLFYVILWAKYMVGKSFPKQTYTCLSCTIYWAELCCTDVVQKNDVWSCLNCNVFFSLIVHQGELFWTKYLIRKGINWFWRSVICYLLEFCNAGSKPSCNLLRKGYYQLGN